MFIVAQRQSQSYFRTQIRPNQINESNGDQWLRVANRDLGAPASSICGQELDAQIKSHHCGSLKCAGCRWFWHVRQVTNNAGVLSLVVTFAHSLLGRHDSHIHVRRRFLAVVRGSKVSFMHTHHAPRAHMQRSGSGPLRAL